MAEEPLHVVIPFYGRVDHLREAVDSVLRQTDARWRLTVVQDDPEDREARAYLGDIADPRYEHVVNDSRLGVAGNFQRCLDLTRGSHVVFLGCDDRLLSTYVESLRAVAAEHPQAAALLPAVSLIDGSGSAASPVADRVKRLLTPRSVHDATRLEGDRALASLLHGNWSYFPSICWRRQTIAEIGFRQDLATTLDLALLSHLLLDGQHLLHLPGPPVFEYRRHHDSASAITAGRRTRFAEERRLFAELEDAARAVGWRHSRRAARWHLTSRLHLSYLRGVDAARRIASPQAHRVLDGARGR
jgi:glycosyltransferase involved in cell wall biosynthesis